MTQVSVIAKGPSSDLPPSFPETVSRWLAAPPSQGHLHITSQPPFSLPVLVAVECREELGRSFSLGSVRELGERREMGSRKQCSLPPPLHISLFPRNPQSFTIPYLTKEQTVPILRGEGEDLTVKIEVFFLTANAEVIEDKMGHIHPGKH